MFVRKVDVRLPGKEHSYSHGARPVYGIFARFVRFKKRKRGGGRLSIPDEEAGCLSIRGRGEVTKLREGR